MSARGLIGILLRMAVRRWPDGLREEQAREWTAELAALGGEQGATRRRLAFALSLALSPASGDGLGPRGWRELLPGLGVRLKPAAGFAAAALVIATVAIVFNGWLAALAVPLGLVAGLRSRLPRFGSAVAVLTAAGGALAVGTFVTFGALSGGEGPLYADLNRRVGAASIAFALVLAVLLAAVSRLATGRRWWAAVPLAVAGLPVTVGLAWALGAVIRREPVWSDALWQRPGFDRSAVIFLALGGTLLAYWLGVGARRRTSTTGAGADTGVLAEWTTGRAAAVVGAVAILAGLGTWIYAITSLDAAADTSPQTDAGQGLHVALVLRSHELRWAGLLLAGLGFFLAVAGRPGAVLGATVLAAVPLAADIPITRMSLVDGPGRDGAAVAVAALAAAVAGWVTGRTVRLNRVRLASARRGLAGVAAAAALCGPLALTRSIDGVERQRLTPGLLTVMVVVPAMFVVVAAFAAALARAERPSTARTAVVTAGPAILVATLGALAMTSSGQGLNPAMSPFGWALGGVLAVVAGAVALGPAARARRRRGVAASAARVLLGVGTVVALPVALAMAAVLSFVPASVLLWADGTDLQPVQLGLSVLPGAAMLALGSMALLSERLLPERSPGDVTVVAAEA